MYYTYLIKSKIRNWIYIGCTDDLRKRFQQHNSGRVKSTKHYIPFGLVYYEAYTTLALARKREYELKHNNQQREILYKRLGL
jgi:putative endonuclease